MTWDGRSLSVGDHVGFHRANGTRGVWKVEAVILGDTATESVYRITVVDRGHASDEFGLRVSAMYVPCILLDTFILEHGSLYPSKVARS